MDIVFVCSPFRDNPDSVEMTEQYCRKLILEGDLPIAPHLYFPKFLNDENEAERDLGMHFGRRFMAFCTRIDILVDKGISTGMKGDIEWSDMLELPKKLVKDLPVKDLPDVEPGEAVPVLKSLWVYTWTEYERDFGQRPDGCSVHLSSEDAKEFVKAYWDGQQKYDKGIVPDSYSREDTTEPVEVVVPLLNDSDWAGIYQRLTLAKKEEDKKGLFLDANETHDLMSKLDNRPRAGS